jgi:hypothetical protein
VYQLPILLHQKTTISSYYAVPYLRSDAHITFLSIIVNHQHSPPWRPAQIKRLYRTQRWKRLLPRSRWKDPNLHTNHSSTSYLEICASIRRDRESSKLQKPRNLLTSSVANMGVNRKKYRKMRIKFDEVMRDSNENYMKEQRAIETGRRLARENE